MTLQNNRDDIKCYVSSNGCVVLNLKACQYSSWKFVTACSLFFIAVLNHINQHQNIFSLIRREIYDSLFLDCLQTCGYLLTDYTVSYKLRGSPDSYTNQTVSASDRRLTVTNLQRQAYYEFIVTASTVIGSGEPGIVEVFTMDNRSMACF